MRILRIKQAEAALADGRLDEASELLADAEIRSHRQGQQLVGSLVRRLVERGGEHLTAGRIQQALADCEKAAELGGNLPEAAELRGRIAAALSGKEHARRRHGELLATAREHLEDGRLSVAEQLLAGAGEDSTRVERLRHEAQARRSAAEAALRRAGAALEREDFATAVDEMLAARAHRAANDETAEMTTRVVDSSVHWAAEEVLRGRLDRGESLLRRLQPLAGRNGRVEDLLRAVAQCRRGWAEIRRGELRRAAEALRRARSMLPEAEWLAQAVEQADRAAAALESLGAGPLGLLDTPGQRGSVAETLPAGLPSLEPPGAELAPAQSPVLAPLFEAPAAAPPPASGSLVPRRFLLRVDGAGSSLVLRDDRVTIGPISSARRPELGLLADPNLPVMSIERTEGDYFLRAESAVMVNDKPTTGRLLADGDKIALSPRCRFRFRLPSAASGSAVLELSTARLPQADVRRVVLLERELILGPGVAAHVRTEHLPQRAVLYVRDGRLLCRSEAQLTIDRRPADASAGLPLDTPVRIGPLGLVVNKV
ncbi:MAG TPA: hypothetical protein VM695_06310 [Phycisphaerae bacterium]|nr:hypothetical protein [Phycisphaerae bacterium]